LNNQKVGSFGDASCFSFYATKNMTTGEGGMVLTNSIDIYKQCKLLRSHGMIDSKTHSMIGYNYRMNEIQAAMGIEQLKKLDDMNKTRIEISEEITNFINTSSSPPISFLQPLFKDMPKSKKCVYFWLPIYTFDYIKFTTILKNNNIEYRHRYTELLNKQPVFYGTKKIKDHCGDKITRQTIGLPNHPGLTIGEIHKIKDVISLYLDECLKAIYDEYGK
jgi:dTDP-4-amino-4,6-dideoxygalactose transaminase